MAWPLALCLRYAGNLSVESFGIVQPLRLELKTVYTYIPDFCSGKRAALPYLAGILSLGFGMTYRKWAAQDSNL